MPVRRKSRKALRILSIETSCDETSVALLETSVARGSISAVKLLHHETATQIPIHRRFGGVVPEVAARTHVAELVSLLERAGIFGKGKSKFDAIAVTKGPGLATALRVGVEAARTLSFATGKPLVGVNHLEGHLASAWLMPQNRKAWKFPILALLVSGGHTELVLMQDYCRYKVLGRTRDDASGEAFDKTAKLLGLPYPGGPELSRLAAKGKADAFKLPRPMLDDPSLDFSFSGLKTAVRVLVESKFKIHDSKFTAALPDLCASIQGAIVDVLVEKTIRAAKLSKPKCIIMVGGVSANASLQEKMAQRVKQDLRGVKLLAPPKGFYTDNAAMVAAAGLWRLRQGKVDQWKKLDAEPELDI